MSSQDTEQQPEYSDELVASMWSKRSDLLYKAWVQVRYHRRRQRFFDLLDKGTQGVTLILGASLFGQYTAVPYVATALSSLGLLVLVFGYGDRKQLHKELADQAATQAASIEEVVVTKLSPDGVAQWAAHHALFCSKAPPPLKTLTLLCEREQSTVDGYPDHVAKPVFWRCWIAQIKG